ncbi:phospholipase D family protein [Novosphingobium rosa]|uniref:phospholipase D family protein n=1 Tax=Novosphingobium rosa TaxID=76978 RepID=UPI0008325F10|nr:phospholipase D family protein [Novosphingobium rosa]
MEILSDSEFAAAVLKLIEAPGSLRCAVAFWGPDLARLAAARDAEVVLDIRMGGTSRNALTAFGLRRDELPQQTPRVTVLNDLHAKIFIGDERAIIGSANASRNALGTAERAPSLLEAGVIFDRATEPEAYRRLVGIYESYRARSLPITRDDFDEAVSAPPNPAARDRHGDAPVDGASLLARLAGNPPAFMASGFIFGDARISTVRVRKAEKALEEVTGQPMSSSRLSHICTFDPDDVADEDELRNSVRIFWFWYGSQEGVFGYTDVVRVVEADQSVSYFGRANWVGALKDVGQTHLKRAGVWIADGSEGLAISARDGLPLGKRFVAMSSEHLFEYIEKRELESRPPIA